MLIHCMLQLILMYLLGILDFCCHGADRVAVLRHGFCEVELTVLTVDVASSNDLQALRDRCNVTWAIERKYLPLHRCPWGPLALPQGGGMVPPGPEVTPQEQKYPLKILQKMRKYNSIYC